MNSGGVLSFVLVGWIFCLSGCATYNELSKPVEQAPTTTVTQEMQRPADFGTAQAPVMVVSQQVGPSYPQQQVRDVMGKNTKKFRDCYATHLKKHPEAYGKVSLEWEIVGKGKVANARMKEADAAVDDPLLGACLVNHVSALKFADPGQVNVIQVTYPLFFSN